MNRKNVQHVSANFSKLLICELPTSFFQYKHTMQFKKLTTPTKYGDRVC